MKRWTQFATCFAALTLAFVPVRAQNSQSTTEKPDEIDNFVREYRKSAAQEKGSPPATVGPRTSKACKKLATWAVLIDGAFDGQKNDVQMVQPLLTAPEDTVWDELTDCANQSHNLTERSEAHRVSANWERLRSEEFQKFYRDSVPVSAPACTDLERLSDIVRAAKNQTEKASKPDNGGTAVRKNLIDCANASYRLNRSRPRSEETDAAEYLSIWTERNQEYLIAMYNSLASDHSELLKNANELVGKYNALLDDYEKQRSIAMQALNANDSNLKFLERAVLFQSMQVQPINCGGTSYSYGKWGTFNFECH